MERITNCIPDPQCRCCKCQGKHCLMDHPGHSHESDGSPIDVWLAAQNPPRQRETDPVKRLHNLVDSLQRCDWCEAETVDGDTVVICPKCAASVSNPARVDRPEEGKVDGSAPGTSSLSSCPSCEGLREALTRACEFITSEQWQFMKPATRDQLRAALSGSRLPSTTRTTI